MNKIKKQSYILQEGEDMIKLGIIYGGVSTEHDVSKMSAKSIISNLNQVKNCYLLGTSLASWSGLCCSKNCMYHEKNFIGLMNCLVIFPQDFKVF